MKCFITAILLLSASFSLSAQTIYTIKADSTLLTGCDSNELIISNHTQNIPGFLYNTGNGRTAFKRGAVKLNDSLYQVGGDTIKVSHNYWQQGGNTWGTTGVFGTLDSNNIDFYTNNKRRGRWMANGNLILDTTADNGSAFQVNGKIYAAQQLQVGAFTPGASAAVSGATIITEGEVRTPAGFNLYDPTSGYNFSGMKAYGTFTALYNLNSPDLAVKSIGGASSGSQVAIIGGLSPTSGSGVVDVLDYSGSSILMTSGSNSIEYDFLNLAPGINQGTYGTGITRGLYINPALYAAADWRAIETVRGDNRLNTITGKTSIGLNAAPTSKLDITGDYGYSQLRMRTTYTPTSSADTNGNTGDFSWDSNYLYIKTSSGWKRTALSTF